MEFGQNLRLWIEENYKTLARFCKQHALNYATIHHYTTGKRQPNKDFLEFLKNLGCDINLLLSETEAEANLVKEAGAEYGINKDEEIRKLREENKMLRDKLAKFREMLDEDKTMSLS